MGMMPLADLFVHVYVLIDEALSRGAVAIPPRPELTLCEGSVALANGFGFARRQPDGTVIGIYPKKPPATP